MKRFALIALLSLATPVWAQQRVVPGSLNPATRANTATPSFSRVTAERLVNSDAEPQNWLHYSGNYYSQRYSRLDQINADNAGGLQMQWAFQLSALDRAETTPLVVDGVMFITEAPSNVIAVDATTGEQFWRYNYPLGDELNFCCGRNNRGVAILDDRLFMSTLDAHLVAIDARTGTLLWEAEVAPAEQGYSKTAAPLVVGDKVVTGIAGGEFGIRGFVDAYDTQTGERLWRFWTIPGPEHPDNATWAGDSWMTGGAGTWMTGSYDPELDLIYWGTGNPGPDWNGDVRLGDNLYSSSVVALHAETGELAWHFQFTPHDVHDWDATQIPLLADAEFAGQQRKLMLWPNRNAWFYVLDRETGRFLNGRPYARQTWAERLDENGRPVRVPGTLPTVEGVTVSPSIGGGSNWWSPSYSPSTGLTYVMAYDGETTFFKRDDEYVAGERFTGGGGQTPEPQDTYHSALRALLTESGVVAWEYPVQPRSTAGVLTTAGDVVVSGTIDGYVFALDARTGRELWYKNLGSRVHSGPMTYMVGGRQYVGVAAGNVYYTFALED